MQDIINNLPKQAKDKHNENKKFFQKLKKKPPKNLDYIMQELHQEEFESTNCLECANCCKTTGPLFTDKDIERIAKFFRLKPKQFIEQYLRVDEDNDYVLQTVPCTFL
ncbi:YkgJ family cysteine cluster protein, partial [Seonamhaeicola sp.]